MVRNNKGRFLIKLLIVLIIISMIFIIGSFGKINKNDDNNDKGRSDLFNKKLIYNFGIGTAYEIDMPQIIKDYNKAIIRKDCILFWDDKEHILISKNETIFEDLPPNEMLVAGSKKSYKTIYEDDTTKLYEMTYTYSYNSLGGAKSEESISYELYRKEDDRTLEITGSNKDKIIEISSFITTTNESKTLEEQFYGVTVLDERIIDTSKVTIHEIYNVDGYLDVGIKIHESLVSVRFLSNGDNNYLPALKNRKNWKLISEKDNYKIYHSVSGGGQSDALKIVKDGEEYFIDLSIPSKLYKNESKIEEDGSTSIYMYLTQETKEKLIQEIFNIIK